MGQPAKHVGGGGADRECQCKLPGAFLVAPVQFRAECGKRFGRRQEIADLPLRISVGAGLIGADKQARQQEDRPNARMAQPKRTC